MSSLSIVADQQILFAKEAFSSFGDVALVDGRSIEQATIENADVLLVRSVTKVNQHLLQQSKIKFVGSATSGIDHIDINYLKQSDIAFAQALGSNARSVAEYVLSSLFVVAENQNFDLKDKTIGIIGCGQVGSRVKRFMDILGVKCLINDPLLAKNNSEIDFVELDEIQKADIITLHVPLTTDGEFPTHKLVNKDFLNKLKSDVILVNTSRGDVVDEAGLLQFKQKNAGATFVLDVWSHEPEIDINLLENAFIATPHIAGYSYDGKIKATQMLFDALNSHFNTDIKQPELLNSESKTININDDAIHLAVLQSYDVRTDAIALSDLIGMEQNQRGTYFDSLRRNYPIRREFKNRIMQTKKIKQNVKQQIQQLGFKVTTV